MAGVSRQPSGHRGLRFGGTVGSARASAAPSTPPCFYFCGGGTWLRRGVDLHRRVARHDGVTSSSPFAARLRRQLREAFPRPRLQHRVLGTESPRNPASKAHLTDMGSRLGLRLISRGVHSPAFSPSGPEPNYFQSIIQRTPWQRRNRQRKPPERRPPERT